MLLFLSGQIFAVVPGLLSLVIVAVLLVALKKVKAIKRNGILSAIVVLVALLSLFAGIFLLYASEFWYVVTGG
jgi:hypothetical protein